MEILLVICLIVILIFYLRLKSYKKKSKEEIKKELIDIGISFGTLTEAIDGNYTAFNNLANSLK